MAAVTMNSMLRIEIEVPVAPKKYEQGSVPTHVSIGAHAEMFVHHGKGGRDYLIHVIVAILARRPTKSTFGSASASA